MWIKGWGQLKGGFLLGPDSARTRPGPSRVAHFVDIALHACFLWSWDGVPGHVRCRITAVYEIVTFDMPSVAHLAAIVVPVWAVVDTCPKQL